MGNSSTLGTFKKKLKTFFSDSGKAAKIIVVIGVLGIALIMLSELLPKEDKKSDAAVQSAASELEASLELRLEQTVAEIDGCGRVKVMVTLEGGVQQISSDEKSADYFPAVKGVAVICEGGDSPVVAERITKAVTTALAIPSTRVCVLKMA